MKRWLSGEEERELDRAERAKASVQALQKELRVIRGFAKALTRNPKIKVAIGPTSSTDGKTIWLRPPGNLGATASQKHRRSDCHNRGADNFQVCPACRAHEEIMSTVYHEISHIVMESFEKLEADDWLSVFGRALTEAGTDPSNKKRVDVIRKRVDAVLDANPTFIAAASTISPFMPMLLNALEDARVNAWMGAARPGTKAGMSNSIKKIMREGIDNLDGTHFEWKDRELNSQALIGVFLFACGQSTLVDHLDESIVEALHAEDDELLRLVKGVETAASVRNAYQLSFPVLEFLRRQGLCLHDQDDEEPPVGDPKKGDEDDEPNESEDDGENVESEDDGGDGAEGDDGEDSADGDPGEGGSQGDGDESDDDAESEGDGQGGAGGEDSADSDSEADSDANSDSEADSDTEEDSGADSGGESVKNDDSDSDADTSEKANQSGLGGEDAPADEGSSTDEYDDKGSPEDAESDLGSFGGHNGPNVADPEGDERGLENDEGPPTEEELDRAVEQHETFDAPSINIDGVVEHTKDSEHGLRTDRLIWKPLHEADYFQQKVEVDQTILQPALNKARVAFTENLAVKRTSGRRKGRISARDLGRRVPVSDDRIFAQKERPKRRDFFVVIGMDNSGSTQGYGSCTILNTLKAACRYQAELLNSLGIPFAFYVHNGWISGQVRSVNLPYDDSKNFSLDIGVIKSPTDPWTDACRSRLDRVLPGACNLDGHAIEYYRKVIESQVATDTILMYYTDGEMPSMNYDEELEVLQREISTLKRMGTTTVGVGVGTDSPKNHGLDTIVLNDIEDVPLVVAELEKRITATQRRG